MTEFGMEFAPALELQIDAEVARVLGEVDGLGAEDLAVLGAGLRDVVKWAIVVGQLEADVLAGGVERWALDEASAALGRARVALDAARERLARA